MAMTDLVSGPFLFAQQLREHSGRVGEAVKLIEPLAEALLARDYEKVRRLQEQVSRIAGEADQVKLALYDQVKELHFCSLGGYAFSRYVSSLHGVVDSARDFADLLLSRPVIMPVELRVAFGALIAQVVSVGTQVINLSKEFASPGEADSAALQDQDLPKATARILESADRARQLERESAECIHRQEGRLNAVTVLTLDRYNMALRRITDAAEGAVDHLRLMIPPG